MQSLKQLCIPRESVFDTQRRDTVLDLTDLIEDKIDTCAFFEENYVTEGMKILLEQSFQRLEGKFNQGIFKLKQAMGPAFNSVIHQGEVNPRSDSKLFIS